MDTFSTTNTYPFLAGGGQAGELIRQVDWSTSSLGTPDHWPFSLRVSVSNLLLASQPMLVLWGEEHICFHNDAVLPSLGVQTQPPIGQPARAIWAEGWDFMGPLLAGVLHTGEPAIVPDAPVPFYWNGQIQEVYWTFSYSLIRDDAGQSGGILVNGQETTEAVRSRQVLGRSQQLVDNLFTSAPVAIALFDGPRFIIEQANELVLNYWGRRREQVMHKPLFEALPEAAGQGFEERLTKVYTTGERFVAKELTVTLERHGQLVPTYIDFVYEPFRQLNGTISGVVVVCTEITEQVLARRNVEESEARFRSLIQEAPVATCLFVGPDMVIEVANEAMIQVWGKGPSVLGQPLAQALPELKEQHFLTTLDHLFKTGEVYDTKGGRADLVVNGVLSTYYFDYTFKPLRNQAGEVYAILETAVDVTGQVKTQQQLIASEKRFRSIVEQAPMAIGLLGGRDMIIQVGNDKLFEVWGKDPSMTGLPIRQALPELQGQVFTDLLDGVYTTGEPYVGQGVLAKLVRHGQLEEVYFDFVYTPLRDTDEQISGVMVLATEVTPQVLARQRIEASEAKLRSVIASAPAGMGLFIGRDLIIDLPNQTFIDIVGKGPDIVGKPLREVMPELLTENQPFLHILDEVYTSGTMFQSVGSPVDIVRQGVMTHNYYNITYTPLRDEQGAVFAILDIAIDVTAQIKAQQALAESEAHLQLLRDTVPAMIFYLDAQERYQSYNETFRQWFGVDQTEVLGKTVRDFVGEVAYQAVQPHLAVAYGGQPEQFELYAPSRMGAERWLSITYTPQKNSQGEVIGLIVHAANITPNKQIELALRESETRYRSLSEDLERQVQQRTQELAANNQALAASNEELEEINGLLMRSNDNLQTFAYVASHDLQEPLRKIQQFGDLLMSRYGDSVGEERLYVERMQLAASRMSALIKDLLNYSRIATQRDTNGPVDLREVVDRVLLTLELLIQETGAQIRVESLPTVLGDASQLGQLVQNLVSNALKFSRVDRQGSPAVPRISITAQRVSGSDLPPSVKPSRLAPAYYRIDVIDNGVGFEEKYLDRIFQVFQRLHGKNEFAGTGVGLAIAQRVVENHGGAITATSQPGQGATFRVYLPV